MIGPTAWNPPSTVTLLAFIFCSGRLFAAMGELCACQPWFASAICNAPANLSTIVSLPQQALTSAHEQSHSNKASRVYRRPGKLAESDAASGEQMACRGSSSQGLPTARASARVVRKGKKMKDYDDYVPAIVNGRLVCKNCQCRIRPIDRKSGGKWSLRCNHCKGLRDAQHGILSGRGIAGSAVGRAVKNGVLPPVRSLRCVDCGDGATCYDHRDYNEPLRVEPVCYACNTLRGSAKPLNPFIVYPLVAAAIKQSISETVRTLRRIKAGETADVKLSTVAAIQRATQ